MSRLNSLFFTASEANEPVNLASYRRNLRNQLDPLQLSDAE